MGYFYCAGFMDYNCVSLPQQSYSQNNQNEQIHNIYDITRFGISILTFGLSMMFEEGYDKV